MSRNRAAVHLIRESSPEETPPGRCAPKMSVMPSSQPLVSRPRHIAVIGNCQAQVIAVVKRDLAAYKAPKRVVFVEQVPRAANGKADYKSARELAVAKLAP